jgi:PiT family inorganic phosphate transporter
MGAGATRGISAVKWGIAGNILVAWLLTLPAAALISAALYYPVSWIF